MFGIGIASISTNRFTLSIFKTMFSFNTVAFNFFALCKILRSSNAKPLRAIFNKLWLGLPAACSRYKFVLPLKCTISIASFTTTPAGVYFPRIISSAVF